MVRHLIILVLSALIATGCAHSDKDGKHDHDHAKHEMLDKKCDDPKRCDVPDHFKKDCKVCQGIEKDASKCIHAKCPHGKASKDCQICAKKHCKHGKLLKDCKECKDKCVHGKNIKECEQCAKKHCSSCSACADKCGGDHDGHDHDHAKCPDCKDKKCDAKDCKNCKCTSHDH